MELNRLKEILRAFADDQNNLLTERNKIVVQIQGELISATLSNRDGHLFVAEDGPPVEATRWVVQRIAQLDLLADRLCSSFGANTCFVTPSGTLLDQLETAPNDDPVAVSDAVAAATEFLGRKYPGMCSVL